MTHCVAFFLNYLLGVILMKDHSYNISGQLSLILHMDESHYDCHSHLCFTPIGVTLGLFDVDTQQKLNAWRQCATIPNLSAKKGSNRKRLLGPMGKSS